MKKIAALLVAFAVLVSAGAAVAQQKLVLEGEKAMSVTDIAEKAMPAKEVFGKKNTALVFSQTACASCRNEISFLTGAMKDYPNVQLVVVVVDMKYDRARIDNYLGAVNFTGQALIDPKWALAQAVGVSYTPATVFITKDGTVVASHAGYTPKDEDKIRENLKKIN